MCRMLRDGIEEFMYHKYRFNKRHYRTLESLYNGRLPISNYEQSYLTVKQTLNVKYLPTIS